MGFIRSTFRQLKFASAFSALLALAGIGTVVAPTVSRASTMDVLDHLDPTDFSAYKLVPGSKWYVINRDIPGTVVGAVQDKLGFQLCKIQLRPGVWVTNLKECKPNHPQMSDPRYGILNPKMDTGNGIGDYIVKNYAYDMPPVRSDLKIADAVQAEYAAYMAERNLASARTRVATHAPVSLLPQQAVRDEVRPVQDKPVRTAVRKAKKVLSRLAAGLPRPRPAVAPVLVAEKIPVPQARPVIDASVQIAAAPEVHVPTAEEIRAAEMKKLEAAIAEYKRDSLGLRVAELPSVPQATGEISRAPSGDSVPGAQFEKAAAVVPNAVPDGTPKARPSAQRQWRLATGSEVKFERRGNRFNVAAPSLVA
jgi:hypothetical protein